MRRPSSFISSFLLLGLAIVATLPAVAGEIYQWKDAKGVTHYSDSPPAGQKHQTRAVNARAATVAPVASKPVANADCSNARSNLELLKGGAKVGLDTDKDGKPDRELTAAERASRLKMAEAQMEIYCDAPSAAAATSRS